MSWIDNPDVHDLPAEWEECLSVCLKVAPFKPGCSENYGFVAIKKNAVFDMPADGARENNFLKIAAFADEVFNGIAVGDADYVLFDDGTVVEDFSDVVAGGANQLHAAQERLVVGLRADKCRQK